jgi:hypothetical protein
MGGIGSDGHVGDPAEHLKGTFMTGMPIRPSALWRSSVRSLTDAQ